MYFSIQPRDLMEYKNFDENPDYATISSLSRLSNSFKARTLVSTQIWKIREISSDFGNTNFEFLFLTHFPGTH